MDVSTMIKMLCGTVVASVILLAGCGPTAEEQRAADQQKCSGFGFQPGTQAFAHCMMEIYTQREDQIAADRRAAQAQNAADQRFQSALKAAKDKPDPGAWDSGNEQGTSISTPDLGTGPTAGMNCTTTINSSGSANNRTSTSITNCTN
jgi:outer membrane murein-binding lipoprotein Lpp